MVSGSYQIIYCHVLTQVSLLQTGLCKLPNHILSCPNSSMSFTKLSLEATKSYIVLPLLKHVFYKMVSGSYQIIYCLVLTQVCLLQNGHCKLPNHILSCPYLRMSFTKWSLEATKSYIVLSLLKFVFYKIVSGSYQIIYCLVLTQVRLLQMVSASYQILRCLVLTRGCLLQMVSGSYQIIYYLVLTQARILQNGL